MMACERGARAWTCASMTGAPSRPAANLGAGAARAGAPAAPAARARCCAAAPKRASAASRVPSRAASRRARSSHSSLPMAVRGVRPRVNTCD